MTIVIPSLARPYAWTEGRTRPTANLAVEALVRTTSAGSAVPYNSADPRSVVARLCLHAQSMAEISALLSVPIGVARVLVSDLLSSGLVHVFDTLTEDTDSGARIGLLERVLDGLRKL
ncbi:DUF742 domain-containing protein [Amycolatopsis sp. NPDC049868]|uniref:DUF742 domain-containing protein n=1 Tax=Amycolatopsis sp. NPDC049868 TaxID=3363934 RepID=UPI0037AB4BF1